jgi:hypothetical protein
MMIVGSMIPPGNVVVASSRLVRVELTAAVVRARTRHRTLEARRLLRTWRLQLLLAIFRSEAVPVNSTKVSVEKLVERVKRPQSTVRLSLRRL